MKLILTTYCNLVIYLISFLYFSLVWGQEKQVRLIEDVQKKRTTIYVQNDTDIDKSVFLKINPIGYRRSAQRPVIKNIPAKSKVQMIILIPLTDVASSYTYNLIVNEELQNMEVDRTKGPKKEAPLSSILKSEIIIFTKEGCEKCQLLITKLQLDHVKFREININSKNRYINYLWKLLNDKGYNKTTAQLPLSLKQGELIHPIGNIDDFVSSVSKRKQ
ncbi:hypothetical protein D1818_21730 [Aquimarina sp. BL5]|uniref:hypothetical protein n=1 Tax=Aquimarina sp. BL5 TaxID=1714860 RepID=UPI000E4C89DA|nr:hypothetical protein [Aquimarina sp. BL5]AXT53317.1 hypothetical protein D1818_21730 [Aquimarina sp. BL5]RKN02760.1 hypothetical protein D7036_15955 [Aquimarina sp. BL5]